MRYKIEMLVPAGIDLQQEFKWIRIGLAAGFIYSLSFFIYLTNGYRALFTVVGNQKVLMEGAVMPDFVDVLGSSLAGFLIVALSMAVLLVYHYIYHFQGSKSIYLMKRLPDRWDLWRRCLGLPVLAALLSLCIAVLLLILYFGIYLLATPEGCLPPSQWME